VYFSVEDDIVVILAALHVSRAPAEWQRRHHAEDDEQAMTQPSSLPAAD